MIGTTTMALLGLLAAAPPVAAPPPFPDARERISYALGVEAGQGFHKRAVDVDPEAFSQGLRDALAGQARLTDEQVRAAIAELQGSLKRREVEARKAMADENRRAASAFLAENGARPGVVTLPSGLQYRVLRPGDGPRPSGSARVTCRYRATLVNGAEFDNSDRGGSSGKLAVAETIAGVQEALRLMPVGSRWEVVVPPSLASGPARAMMLVPPNQALIYDPELVSID
jgi:FKBP-type peptidyl-prolyl cis-trans isomerase FklB